VFFFIFDCKCSRRSKDIDSTTGARKKERKYKGNVPSSLLLKNIETDRGRLAKSTLAFRSYIDAKDKDRASGTKEQNTIPLLLHICSKVSAPRQALLLLSLVFKSRGYSIVTVSESSIALVWFRIYYRYCSFCLLLILLLLVRRLILYRI
jgi:hypothetical protein